jgi:Fic family protein
VEHLKTRGMSKPDYIKAVIGRKLGAITQKEIMGVCPDISKITVERTLAALVRSGELVLIGAGRGEIWEGEQKMEADPISLDCPMPRSKTCSRVLTTLLLMRTGYAYVPYASLERVIEENKDFYYKALRRTQTTLNRETPDWEPWVSFFLRSPKRQNDGLAARLKQERIAQDSEEELPELSRQVIKALQQNERLTITQLVEMTGANRNTLKVRLRELVAVGRGRQFGKARATRYSVQGSSHVGGKLW